MKPFKKHPILTSSLFFSIIILLGIGVFYKQHIKQFLIDRHAVDFLADLRSFGEMEIGGDEVIANLKYKNLPLVVNKRDRCVCLNIRIRGTWERPFFDKILSLVKQGDTVLEIGANYGIYTIPMANKIGPSGKYIAYEANPLVYKSLRKSLVLNELENVKLYNLAVSNNTGKLVINYAFQNLGGAFVSSTTSNRNENSSFIVDSIVLDEVHNNMAVDLLKIDVEGSEINILPHAKNIIKNSPNILLAMEWSPKQMRRYNDNIAKFIAFLEDNGFSILELELNGKITRRQKTDLLLDDDRELLLYKKGSESHVLEKLGEHIR